MPAHDVIATLAVDGDDAERCTIFLNKTMGSNSGLRLNPPYRGIYFSGNGEILHGIQ
jgi:hypothetical protein